MDILPAYLHASRCVEQEFSQFPLTFEGTVPSELQGTLFRNGNGRFEHQGVTYDHLFDGDGMVSAFTFDDGNVRYSNRYVRTAEFEREEAAGRMLYRSFGTNLPGGFHRNFLRMHFKNAANTNVIFHGGKLLALWEGGWPHRLDPATLNTLDRYSYGGVLRNNFSALDRRITPELPFSAHPKVHPESGEMYNFGTAAGRKQRLILYRISPDGQARIDQAIELPELIFAHDFVLTRSGFQVFFLTPVAFDLFRTFTGLTTPVGGIRVDPAKATRILVVDPAGKTQYYETEFCFAFHFANAFEASDGTLVVDALTMPDFPSAESVREIMHGNLDDAPAAHLVRYRIDRAGKSVTKKTISPHPVELPRINPAFQGTEYRFAYSIAGAPDAPGFLLTGIQKADLQHGDHRYRECYPCLMGEPVFVARHNATAEDDGWLLQLRFDPRTTSTEFVIYDARDLTEIAKATLPHNIPLGFHGNWYQQLFD